MSGEQKEAIKRYFKKKDPAFLETILVCRGACLFSHETEWKDTGTEGTFYFYRRSAGAKLRIVILDVKSRNDFEMDVSPQQSIECHPNFLIFHTSEPGRFWGVWFFSKRDAAEVYECLNSKLISNPRSASTS